MKQGRIRKGHLVRLAQATRRNGKRFQDATSDLIMHEIRSGRSPKKTILRLLGGVDQRHYSLWFMVLMTALREASHTTKKRSDKMTQPNRDFDKLIDAGSNSLLKA